MRIGAVTADAADRDINGVDIGLRVAGDVSDLARRDLGVVVKPDCEIRLREFCVKTSGEKCLRAGAGLFCGLPDENEGAVPLVF